MQSDIQNSRRRRDIGEWRLVAEFFAMAEECVQGLRLRPGEAPLYRGDGGGARPLLPSLMRAFTESELKSRRFRETERDLFFEFEARSRRLTGNTEDEWDILFRMQHYGVPTRLLDWTESLLMAVYFALKWGRQRSNARPAIWILNPYALNSLEAGWGFRDLVSPRYLIELYRQQAGKSQPDFHYRDWLSWRLTRVWPIQRPIALYPAHTNERLQAQRGMFTLHGHDMRPLEKQFGGKSECLRTLSIAPAMGNLLIRLLDHAGLRHFLMYQHLDGLGRELSEEYLPNR